MRDASGVCILPDPSSDRVQTTADIALRIERVGMDQFPTVQRLNVAVFDEVRVINQLDRPDLVMLLAYRGPSAGSPRQGSGQAGRAEEPVGFKVGYGESETTFYSAKGGVLEMHRGRGIAKALLVRMMDEARALGYERFAFDTFPNMHPGMTVLGLRAGFRVTAAGYNATYQDYRLRLEKGL